MCIVQGTGCKVQGSGFRVQGSGFRVQGPGFRNADQVAAGQGGEGRPAAGSLQLSGRSRHSSPCPLVP